MNFLNKLKQYGKPDVLLVLQLEQLHWHTVAEELDYHLCMLDQQKKHGRQNQVEGFTKRTKCCCC
jgi:hypothetical protein